VGTFQVLEGTELVLYSLPGAAAFRPLWEALANGAVGGVVLAGAYPPLPPFARIADGILRLPFLAVVPGLPPHPGAPDWEPAVPWAVAEFTEGNEEAAQEVFRTFFRLVLGS
jgi:hypothetical protein